MRLVDHEERRLKIAEAAADVIAREGLEAATVRRIAKELGVSTKAVTHYFPDKDQLLLWVFRTNAKKGQAEFEESILRDSTDLVGALLSLTAAAKDNVNVWHVYVAFWDKAGRDPVFEAEQRVWVESALARIDSVICARNGDLPDIRGLALQLIALVQGVSLLALFDLESWPPEKIRSVLAHQVEVLLGRAAS